MGFTAYKSTDGSAPSLTGQTGSLVALLDAILVNGYGAKAAAGWTKSFSATSKAVYRLAGGSQFYLDVDDSGPGAGTFKEARARGYEAASGVGAGTGPFPAAAQLAAGIIIRKSSTADGTARAWKAWADGYSLYLAVNSDAGTWRMFAFGDFYSLAGSGDLYRCHIQGRITENTASSGDELIDTLQTTRPNGMQNGKYVARLYTGLGASNQFNTISGMYSKGSASVSGSTSMNIPFPNPVDNGMYIEPFWLVDNVSAGSAYPLRGRLRGMWCIGHAHTNFSDGDTFNGAGDYSGKTFEILKTSPSTGALVFETSNTLELN